MSTGPAVLVVLTVLSMAGQIVGFVNPGARPGITLCTVIVLDLIGAGCGWWASRLPGVTRTAGRLIALGRVVDAVSFMLYGVAAATGSTAWLAALLLTRLVMYLLLAVGGLAVGLVQFSGRARSALIAEVVTMLAAGFMVIWYVALGPVLSEGDPGLLWIGTIGWPLGDLLLLTAVAAVMLRGAVTRFAVPVTLFTLGLGTYAVGDLYMTRTAATGLHGGNMIAGTIVVGACLLLTAAALLALSWTHDRAHQARTDKAPAWSTYLPLGAMVAGGVLMLAVTLLEGQFLPWGGLVCGLIGMTCAAAARQMMSLRDSRELLITDSLTGLANRAGLDDALDRALKRGESPAVLLIDLDGFKLVNDAYGHAAGDAFLIHVAHQLRGGVRGKSTIARIGGDEFAVLINDITEDEQAASIGKRLLANMAAHPVTVDDDQIPLRASVGGARYETGLDDKALLRRADVAMYQSKRAGSHGFTLYQPGMVDRRAVDAALAEDLEHALERNEMRLVFQPIVDTADGAVLGAEALLRWEHGVRGPIRPDEFIPVAERSGTIIPIGLWVLERALAQLGVLPENLYISVNLSPRQLREPTIVHDVLAVLERTGIPARRLVLEITESALVDDTSGIKALHSFRTHGIRIAVDDFGTGYSSLQYLTRLPVDILKIDRSFVAELDGSPEGAAVTTAIIHLANALHLRTIAEGIETPEQADELRGLGCVTGQGYLYAKPLPPGDLVKHVMSGAAEGSVDPAAGRRGF
ncbi:bifunctional diguanylate cyclase/phosphodiesterase [Actinoplanes sp. NPDC051851]|uniref:putative bifunctional diguanylate cyclase/phosphodiesterase n=1 Tax=Actinoplanes sp. NPDC051851 TaxID=3154753 RepID=UPI00342B0B7B